MTPPRKICRIGPLSLDVDNEVLLRDGVPLPLGRRAISLLKRLVETPAEIVRKNALYEAAWSGQAVEESNLTVQVSLLRRTLRAETADGGSWIETLARRGYRFIGPVAWQAGTLMPPPGAEPNQVPLAAPAPPGISAVPAVAGDVSNVPFAVPLHFTGRAAELDAVHSALSEAAHQPAVVVLHGMRGVGKTVLAAAYARQRAAVYRITWWLRAEAVATLRADIAALAIRLGWARPDSAEDAAFASALDGLRYHGKGVLLIYDNAADANAILPYLPKSGAASVLITANGPAWRAYARPLELGVWPASVGAGYLIARTGQDGQRDDAERLSEALGGLPLAHEQAAAYIESLELSFSDYLRRFHAAPARLLGHITYAPADYHNGLTVARAFRLAIEQAAVLHPAAEPLLHYAALLAPEPLPVFLFREGREAFDEPLATQLAGDGLDEALAALRGFALISRAAVADEHDPAERTDCLRVHRLVRQVATASLDDAAKAMTRRALIKALAAVYPARVFDNPSLWPRARRLDGLAMPLVSLTATIPDGAEASASVLLNGLASFRHRALADFGQARLLLERAYALAESAIGPADPFTARTLNNLALVFRDKGDLVAAGPLHERALAIREAALGPDHPDVAVSLINLANVVAEQGDPASACPLLERALAIRRTAYGEAHEQTAQVMNNLARQLHRLGDLRAARVLHERALAIREASLGPRHPSTANSLNNLALLYLDFASADAARALGERSVSIAELALGPDHPETAAYRANLAKFILAQRDPAAAFPVAERALAALAVSLAPGALAIRSAAAIAADCLDALNRGAEAARLRRVYVPATQP